MLLDDVAAAAIISARQQAVARARARVVGDDLAFLEREINVDDTHEHYFASY